MIHHKDEVSAEESIASHKNIFCGACSEWFCQEQENY